MKTFIFATILAVSAAGPIIEDTEDVKAAKAKFYTAFAAAEARKPVPTVYIPDTPEVSNARDDFRTIYDMYAAGEVPLPVAPVHNIKPADTIYTGVVPNHIEDTDDVKAAKAEFAATFAEVKAREPVATAYIADTSEVSDARDESRAVFDKFSAG